MAFNGVGALGGELGGWKDEKGESGRDGCGLVWRVESGGRFADMSAWAAARELGDGARSMSAVCECEVSGLGVGSERRK